MSNTQEKEKWSKKTIPQDEREKYGQIFERANVNRENALNGKLYKTNPNKVFN